MIKTHKEPCPELEQLYKAETGNNALYGEGVVAAPSLLYVEWLEQKTLRFLNIERWMRSMVDVNPSDAIVLKVRGPNASQ